MDIIESTKCIQQDDNSFQRQFEEQQIDENVLNQMITKGREIFILKDVNRINKQVKILYRNKEIMKGYLQNYNRRERSLQLLTKRFLNLMEYQEGKIIKLKKVCKQLGVKMIKLYDIIKILQSLQVIQKRREKCHIWKGVNSLVKTIEKYKLNQILEDKTQEIVKKKSLKYLSISFLNLFLHWKSILTLEEATKKLFEDDDTINHKTITRRLYDIINVYKSLGLVEKIYLQNNKSAFQWIGISLPQQLLLTAKKCPMNKLQPEQTSSSNIPFINFSNNSFFQQHLLSTTKKLYSTKHCNIFEFVDSIPRTFQPINNSIQNLFQFVQSRKQQVVGFRTFKYTMID